MSTYIYLECHDHEPPLRAEDESGQHDYDLPRIRADIAMRKELVRKYRADPGPIAMASIVGYFSMNSAKFLSQHEDCEIGIRDEYGVEYPLKE